MIDLKALDNDPWSTFPAKKKDILTLAKALHDLVETQERLLQELKEDVVLIKELTKQRDDLLVLCEHQDRILTDIGLRQRPERMQ